MKILGINALNHDASLAVVENGKVLYHEKSICGIDLCPELVNRALVFGRPDVIAWYEKPWLKKSRQLYAGQYKDAFNLSELPFFYLKKFGLGGIPIQYVPHHLSHAANAVYESGFTETAVIVADAIGEWDTVSIWHYKDGKFRKTFKRQYPYSLGLFYSAFTELLNFKPVQDENKLTALAQDGDYEIFYSRVRQYLTHNLHTGIWDWEVKETDRANIAASVQRVFIDELKIYFKMASFESNSCILTGGCAYNTPAKYLLHRNFKHSYIPKNPGDAGSSIGAALYTLNNQ
jgi:carbamoyltransferase